MKQKLRSEIAQLVSSEGFQFASGNERAQMIESFIELMNLGKEQDEDNSNPYCEVCTGCGEDGCCSALNCKFSKDGKYCEWYLRDLKFGYIMYRDLYNLVKDKKKRDEIHSKNWDYVYKQDDSASVPDRKDITNEQIETFLVEFYYDLRENAKFKGGQSIYDKHSKILRSLITPVSGKETK